jgi:hypothetical protein
MSDPAAKKLSEKVAISRAELILLVLLVMFGMGAWALVERHVAAYTQQWEMREEQAQIAHGVPRLSAGLSMTQDERKATQEQLIQARLEVARQTAALDALTVAGPAPAQAAADTPKTDAPKPPAAAAAHAEALVKREAAARLTNDLTARLALLQSTADEQAARLDAARGLAARDFNRSRADYRVLKAVLTLLLTVPLMALGWLAAVGLRRFAVARSRLVSLSAGVALLWATFALLCALLFYQAFEMAGAAFVGVVCLLVLLALIPRPSRGGEAASAGGAETR